MGSMIEPIFKNRAINLFAYSQTARTELGLSVHRHLYNAPNGIFQWLALRHDEEAVTHRRFDQVSPSNSFGDAVKEFIGLIIPMPLIISVNDRFKDNVILTSLQLVHECVHLLKWKESRVEQELHAYHLTAEYYQELRNGIFVVSEEKKYQLTQTYMPQEDALRKLRTGKLVDWLVGTYGIDDITPEWVIGHINYWGGIKNRELNTMWAYCHVIVRDNARTFKAQDVYLDLLESMPKKERSKLRNGPRHRHWIEIVAKLYADAGRRKRFQAIAEEIGLKI
jgi:hypothetical protein